MNISSDIRKTLRQSREHREEFAAALVKRSFPTLIRTIRKKRGMSQVELAQASKVDQGVISRAEDPDYGNLTFNTVLRVAAGLDLYFVPRLLTEDEFLNWVEKVSEGFPESPSAGTQQVPNVTSPEMFKKKPAKHGQ